MKKTKESKLYTFDVPLYPRKLWVLIGEDYEKHISKFKRKEQILSRFPSHAEAATVGEIQDANSYAGILIWLSDPKVITHGVIAHEALHALDYIMFDINASAHKYEADNEQDCYLIEWIVDTVEDCLTKYKKK